MDFTVESVRRLVTQVPGWQLALFGCVVLFAWWKHNLSHLLTTLAFLLYAWLTYQYAMIGFDSIDQQTMFGVLVGGGLLLFMLITYHLFAHSSA